MMSDPVLMSKWVVLRRLSNGAVSWMTGEGERFLALAIEEEGQGAQCM